MYFLTFILSYMNLVIHLLHHSCSEEYISSIDALIKMIINTNDVSPSEIVAPSRALCLNWKLSFKRAPIQSVIFWHCLQTALFQPASKYVLSTIFWSWYLPMNNFQKALKERSTQLPEVARCMFCVVVFSEYPSIKFSIYTSKRIWYIYAFWSDSGLTCII